MMKLSKFQDHGADCYLLRVTEDEALALIQSLAQQIRTKSANSGRLESYTKAGEYFSISVHPNDSEL